MLCKYMAYCIAQCIRTPYRVNITFKCIFDLQLIYFTDDVQAAESCFYRLK